MRARVSPCVELGRDLGHLGIVEYAHHVEESRFTQEVTDILRGVLKCERLM